jgi:hypothetical protein
MATARLDRWRRRRRDIRRPNQDGADRRLQGRGGIWPNDLRNVVTDVGDMLGRSRRNVGRPSLLQWMRHWPGAN